MNMPLVVLGIVSIALVVLLIGVIIALAFAYNLFTLIVGIVALVMLIVVAGGTVASS